MFSPSSWHLLRWLQELAGFLSPGAALPHSCRKPPVLWWGCATDGCCLAPELAWHSCLSTQARFEALQPSSSFGARPAGQGCFCPCLTGSLLGTASGSPGRGCSCRITPVPLLPGIVNAARQHQSAPAGSLHRQCWGRQGSMLLLEKD